MRAAVASALVPCLVIACTAAPGLPAVPADSQLTDSRDGQAYPIVVIGSQVWLARDLSFDAPGSDCHRGSKSGCPPDGRLYPWRIATTACPQGWHLPDEREWQALERHLDMPEGSLDAEGMRGSDQGAQLRLGGASGFAAPLAGYRRPDGSYARRDERSAYWLATIADDTAAWHRDIRADDDRIYRSAVPIDYALSVRCLRNPERRTAIPAPASNAPGVVRDSKIARGSG